LGFSATQDHGYSATLTIDDAASITQALTDRGFKVSINNQMVPESVTGPLVVYSPAHENTDLVSEIGDMLAALGFSPVEYRAYTVGNHVYSGNNIGVYPRPHQHLSNAMPEDMPSYFRAKCPDHSGTLEIIGEHEFVFDYGPKASEKPNRQLAGTVAWQEDSLVRSTSDKLAVAHHIFHRDSTNEYGTTRRVTIKPAGEQSLMGCEFWIAFVR